MKVTIEISKKYIPALKEISTTWGMKTIESFCESEILSVIKENLTNYGYDKNGNKIKPIEDKEDSWIWYGHPVQKPANVF